MTERQMFAHAKLNWSITNFYFAILMFLDFEYLKQGFLETLKNLVLTFVLNLKNNSFPKS